MKRIILTLIGLGIGLVATAPAFAAGGQYTSPNQVAPERYVYYPGTEKLDRKEIRVTACGTGMPAARHGQAAACFLMEFGNGDKIIFDIGTGSMDNIAAYMIPYEYLNKIFLTHLHTDHMGDLDSLWAGGWTAGRPTSLKVWGPSGLHPELGTKAMIDGFLKFVAWDKETRSFAITPKPGEVDVVEFDYKAVNQVVYDEDGVIVRSIPAIHTGDGPVSYIVEYEGMRVVIGGDTAPNKWFIEHAVDSDLVVHEAFMVPGDFVAWYNQPPQLAWRACCAFHTSGQAFGKIMSQIKPKHGVAYHFLNEEATRYNLYGAIRETYDGPLSMASDNMVWNITPEGVEERMAVITEEAWSVPGPTRQGPPEQEGRRPVFSQFSNSGYWLPAYEAQDDAMDEHMNKYNLQDQDWRPGLYKMMRDAEKQ
ncbi:MAG: guanitoxin biosynthesis MBL fold metallo-hydrolase GntH [Gammaproteobacteria bacterium]